MSRWLPVVMVGQALSPEDAAQAGREYIEWTDQMAKDVHFPGVAEIVYLQGALFDIADDLGVGDEVRAMVYSLRSVSYFGVAANAMGFGPYGATGAAAGLVASVGSFGAIAAGGAIVLVGALLGGLFGDDSDEEKARRKKRRERIEKDLRDLLKPVSLATLAAEQDRIASAWNGSLAPASPEESTRKATALKLAAFFRAAKVKLSASERQLFEGLLNVGRWGHALSLYKSMSPSAQQNLSTLAYEGGYKYSGPHGMGGNMVPVSPIIDYGARLQARLDQALGELSKRRWEGTANGPSGAGALLLSAGALIAWAALSPSTAMAAWRTASTQGARLWTSARRIVT